MLQLLALLLWLCLAPTAHAQETPPNPSVYQDWKLQTWVYDESWSTTLPRHIQKSPFILVQNPVFFDLTRPNPSQIELGRPAPHIVIGYVEEWTRSGVQILRFNNVLHQPLYQVVGDHLYCYKVDRWVDRRSCPLTILREDQDSDVLNRVLTVTIP